MALRAPKHILRAAVCLIAAAAIGQSAIAASSADTSRVPLDPTAGHDILDTTNPLAFVPRPADLTVGEKLTYEIRWSGVPAGRAVLAIKLKRPNDEGHEVYHAECKTDSNSFVALVYPVSDRSISLIDVAGGFSRLFKMTKSEGRINQSEHIRFDYEKNLAIYEQHAPGPFRPRSRKAVRIDGPVQDPLSCLYYLRSVELVPGATLHMPVHTSRRPWTLGVNVVKREELTIPRFGTVKTLRLEPSMSFPGIFVRKGRMSVWVEEQTGVPVLMHVDIPIGSVVVTLVDAENAPIAPISTEDAPPAEE